MEEIRIVARIAYLGFELDRVVRRYDANDDVEEDLRQLRSDLRDVVSEVRDTLYDLRTDVDESREFAAVVAEFAAELARLGTANFLYSDGDTLFAHAHQRRRPRSAAPASLSAAFASSARSLRVGQHRCSPTRLQTL